MRAFLAGGSGRRGRGLSSVSQILQLAGGLPAWPASSPSREAARGDPRGWGGGVVLDRLPLQGRSPVIAVFTAKALNAAGFGWKICR